MQPKSTQSTDRSLAQFATESAAQFADADQVSCAPVCAWIMDRDDVDSPVDYMPTSFGGEVSR